MTESWLQFFYFIRKKKKQKQFIDLLGQELILKVGFNDTAGNRNSPSVSLPIALPYTSQYFYSSAHALDFELLVSSNPAFQGLNNYHRCLDSIQKTGAAIKGTALLID